MTEFTAGQRVRITEGELEGIEGFVVVSGPHVTSVKLNLMTGEVTIPIYTEMLMSGDEDHEALKTLNLYPDLLKGNHMFRLSTYVEGIVYVSHPMSGEMVKKILKTPPAGLETVDHAETGKGNRTEWKLLWEV